VRAPAAAGLDFLGVALDAGLNERARGEQPIGADRAPVQTLVLPAREDLEIARQVRAVLARRP
jgi:acetate kinase